MAGLPFGPIARIFLPGRAPNGRVGHLMRCQRRSLVDLTDRQRAKQSLNLLSMKQDQS